MRSIISYDFYLSPAFFLCSQIMVCPHTARFHKVKGEAITASGRQVGWKIKGWHDAETVLCLADILNAAIRPFCTKDIKVCKWVKDNTCEIQAVLQLSGFSLDQGLLRPRASYMQHNEAQPIGGAREEWCLSLPAAILQLLWWSNHRHIKIQCESISILTKSLFMQMMTDNFNSLSFFWHIVGTVIVYVSSPYSAMQINELVPTKRSIRVSPSESK